MSFAQELQERLGEHEPEEIEELILDGLLTVPSHLSKEQKEDLEKYKKLIHLTMNGVGLKNLENFPKLPELNILELSNNHLTGKDLHRLVTLYPKLYKVKLNNNKIDSLDDFKGLEGSKITKISVLENPFIETDNNYKKKLFDMLPNLKAIDNEDKDGNDVPSTEYGEEDDIEGELDEEGEGEEVEDCEEFDEEDEDDNDDGEDDEEDDEIKGHKKQKH